MHAREHSYEAFQRTLVPNKNRAIRYIGERKRRRKLKKGYWVVAYRSISDEQALQEYGKFAMLAIAAHGGRAIIRTPSAAETHEAGLSQRTVVVEFESVEKAVETYHSEAYGKALQALGAGAERDFRIVEGVG